MATGDTNATIELRAGHQGGTEPWSQTTTLEVGLDGFRDPGGVGRSGEDPAVVGAGRVAAMLLESYDRDELCAVLDHLVSLRQALKQ